MIKVIRKPKIKSRVERRNEYFIENVYSEFRELFKAWGRKFANSSGMTSDEAESEAIKIALEQTDIRIDSVDEFTVANIIHATKQRMINLCNRNIAQKRNNYSYASGYYCSCGRTLTDAGICDCGREVNKLIKKRVKIHDVPIDDMRSEGGYDDDSKVKYNYKTEYINQDTYQEERIYLKEFIGELRNEMNWRFRSEKVRSNLNIIYELLVEHSYSEKEICDLLDMEDSTFYLYRSRIMECYYIVKNKLEGKFARKIENK